MLVFQVKILVPNSTAGMIIGKAGNFIKQIKEESGAYVQISQKSKETNLPERCVTVAGESTGTTSFHSPSFSLITFNCHAPSCRCTHCC